MSETSESERHRKIQRVRGHLEQGGFPRFQMLLLVVLTGVSGFIASYLLLQAGFVAMWLRYLMAFGVAYAMFLVLLWFWLRTRAEDYADLPDFSGGPSFGNARSAGCYDGKGGDFGGGGASASFDTPAAQPPVIDDAGVSLGDAFGNVAEADEFALPLAVLLCLAVMAFSAAFMIYSAPMLFAELLVDGVLSASLYRRLRGLETRHWLRTALRRTALPFAMTAVLVSATGWGMALYAPEAHSIGEVISHARQAA